MLDEQSSLGSRLRNAAFGICIGLCVGLMALMSRSVMHQLEEFDSATSDNAQWTLAQLDVEFLRFRVALEAVRRVGPEGLDELRKRFDVFYSRIDTFRASRSYGSLRVDPGFADAYDETVNALHAMVPQIDATDAALIDSLPQMVIEAGQMEERVRSMSLRGLGEFARAADVRRHEVTGTLLRLAGLTIGLLIAISLLAISLLRLYRLSERRGAEQLVTGSRLKTIVETSLDGILVCDHNARILDYNGAAESIFGYTREEATGRDMISLILPPELAETHRESLQHYLETGETVLTGRGRMTMEAIRRDGNRFPVEMSVEAADGHDGVIFVVFVRDISHRQQVEAELLEARDKALAGEKAKAEFLAVMSHEMRTPLNGLLGTLSLMHDTGLEPRQRRYVETMEVSGRLLLSLVNDVLDLSKYEAGKLQADLRPCSLAPLVDDIVAGQADLAEVNGNTLDWSWQGDALEHVLGDAPRIRQVLLNFVGNAIKFTRDGAILIELENIGPAPAATPGGAARHMIEFRVIDSGIGIPAEDLDRIFQDFETLDSSYNRKAGGTGLGLGISRRLAGMMGGEIGAESEPGEGSTFWLRLPLEPVAAPAPAEEPAPVQLTARDESVKPVNRALSVLIVEDNAVNRTVLREMVLRDGHAVEEAHDGQEGVSRADAKAYDLILMDISMPVMDGREATRAIRTGHGPSRHAPIIGVTAHALPEEVQAFRAAGMTDCIAKPVDRKLLLRLLSRFAGDGWRAGAGEATPAAETLPDSRLLDLDRLDEVANGVGPAGILTLLDRYMSETDTLMARLKDELPALPPGAGANDEPARGLLAELHRCSGAGAAFGAEAMHARIRAIETGAKRGELAPLRAAAMVLPPLWLRTRAQAEAWRDRVRAAEAARRAADEAD